MSSSVRRRQSLLPRLALERDASAGLNTAGHVHGPLARWLHLAGSEEEPMMTGLGIVAGFVLTATLLTVATVLAAFQLGRLATRDDEQRQVEAAGARRNRGRRATGRRRYTR